MSIFARPSVAIAIIFGCFAVLIPRIILPLLRSRPSPPSRHTDDHFRRPPPPMARSDNDDTMEHTPGSSPHMRGVHPNMRGQHPGVNNQKQPSTEQTSSKSLITFALPMYTVGIAIFFIYTCCKYWAKRNTQEDKMKLRYSTDNIQWNAQKRKFKYNMDNQLNEFDDDEDNEDLYSGLDPDYVEYLKLKREKEREAKQNLTTDQRQMHNALDEMKNSLSFISSKLERNQTKSNLSNNEISQLQERLAATESQMYKILSALDTASNQVNRLTKNTRESLEQPQQVFINKREEEDEEYHLSSGSHSESEGSDHDEENSDTDENSDHHEEHISYDNKQQLEESSSSYEEDEEVPHEIEENDDESESSSGRYGIMDTNYACDPVTIDDYELNNSLKKSEETSDSRTKVQEWRQRNHSQSLSSSNSSIEQDQSIPTDEQNRLTRRKLKKN